MGPRRESPYSPLLKFGVIRMKRRRRVKRAPISTVLLALAIAILAGAAFYLYGSMLELSLTLEQQREEFLETQQRLDEAGALIEELLENLRANRSVLEGLQREIERLNERLETLKPRSVEYFAIGILDEGVGEVISLRVTLAGEENSVAVDLSYVTYGENIQKSARDAVAAVAFLENKKSLEIGVQIRVGSPEEIARVDGPSAGAAMAIAIFACLHDEQIDNGVLITGAIRPNATIGWVGSVEEKAIAARDWGARLLLVPRGQRVAVDGIEIVEVSDLREAIAYVLKGS